MLQNTRILVCKDCLDVPQEQLRAIIVPADPVPIMNARVQDFAGAEQSVRTTSGDGSIDPTTGIPVPGNVQRITQDGQIREPQISGAPLGYEQTAIMPLEGPVHYGFKLPVLSMMANGSDQITVTCSAVHNLETADQVSVEGAYPEVCGLYSVIVTTATAFTYQVNRAVASGSVMGSQTRVVTANVGLPYNQIDVPQTGGP